MNYSDLKELVVIIERLKNDFPGRSLKRLVRDAERVYTNRKRHEPIERGPPPEHVLRNIQRVKRAEEERRKQGRSLSKARLVQGGTGSKRGMSREQPKPFYSDHLFGQSTDSEVIRQPPQKDMYEPIKYLDYELPEEVDKSEARILREGSIRQVTVNAYERSPDARRKCIAHYGAPCYVCSFDFETRYGEVGKGFIHIHHERPLATIGEEYEVDPVKDLKPVCPNCHAIIHRRKPAYTITEMKAMLCEPSREDFG